MAQQDKAGKFGIGLLMGALIGGVTAFFLSPTSGKQNRKMVADKVKELETLLAEKELDKRLKEIFGEVTEEAQNIYKRAKSELVGRLAELKESIAEIDQEKYKTAAQESVELIKKQFKRDAKEWDKLKMALFDEWKSMRSPKERKVSRSHSKSE